MTNNSYAITMSLIRIGVLAAQIAVSPSAACRDFLVDEGDRLVDLVRDLPCLGNADIVWTCSKRARRCASELRRPLDSSPCSSGAPN